MVRRSGLILAAGEPSSLSRFMLCGCSGAGLSVRMDYKWVPHHLDFLEQFVEAIFAKIQKLSLSCASPCTAISDRRVTAIGMKYPDVGRHTRRRCV